MLAAGGFLHAHHVQLEAVGLVEIKPGSPRGRAEGWFTGLRKGAQPCGRQSARARELRTRCALKWGCGAALMSPLFPN